MPPFAVALCRIDLLHAVHSKTTTLFRADRVSMVQMTSGGAVQTQKTVPGFIVVVHSQAASP